MSSPPTLKPKKIKIKSKIRKKIVLQDCARNECNEISGPSFVGCNSGSLPEHG
jgi:hypothetical protein